MNYDTAGKPIYKQTKSCDCGLTGGCEKCNLIFKRQWSILDEVPITQKEHDYYEKLSTLLIAECQCRGKHYLQVDEWDEATGQVMLSLIGEPSRFRQWFKWYWQHRKVWVNDIILNKAQQEALIAALKNPTQEGNEGQSTSRRWASIKDK